MNATDRIDPEPAERKLMPARERSRQMLAVFQKMKRLDGHTDIHSHREREELKQRLDELRAA
jgi:hypothetical protein